MAASIRMCSKIIIRTAVSGQKSLTGQATTSGPHNIPQRLTANRPVNRHYTAEVNSKEREKDTESETSRATQIDIETLQQQNHKLLAQFEETQDKYRRALAETENVRHRLSKQIEDAKLFGIQGFCKDLLEVSDILNKATESLSKEELASAGASLKQLYEGLQLTESQLLKVFTRHGLVKIAPAEGEKFNPNVHEALFQLAPPAGRMAGTVGVVSKVGYTLHSRTLRPAVVGVYTQS